MGRYRPPPPKKSPYITSEGAQKLRAELQFLWKTERPQVTQAVHEAAKNGDRSENGDYIYGKRRLREIDRRVRYITKRLDEVTVVNDPPRDTGKVYFGACVTIVDEEDVESTHRIVGADEIDAAKGWVSIDSPIARALIGKRVDDEVSVQTPQGERFLVITRIQYF